MSALAQLGFTADVLTSADASVILLPTNAAWTKLATSADMAIDMDFIMLNQDRFKQIFLHHVSSGTAAGEEANTITTALSKLPELEEAGFIDTAAVCGQMDSQYINLQYAADADGITFREPVGQHYESKAVAAICNTPELQILTVDTVLTPCPVATLFAGDTGCMTVAAAAAQLPGHILGALPYSLSDASFASALKHPNALLSGMVQGATVFLPSAEALAASPAVAALAEWPAGNATVEAALTPGETTALPASFLDMVSHVLSFHATDMTYRVGGADAALNTLAPLSYCLNGESSQLMVDDGGADVAGVVSTVDGQMVPITGLNNNAVCGGVLHVIDGVLEPCPVADYLPVAQEDTAEMGAMSPDVSAADDGTQEEAGAPSAAFSNRFVAALVGFIAVAAAMV